MDEQDKWPSENSGTNIFDCLVTSSIDNPIPFRKISDHQKHKEPCHNMKDMHWISPDDSKRI